MGRVVTNAEAPFSVASLVWLSGLMLWCTLALPWLIRLGPELRSGLPGMQLPVWMTQTDCGVEDGLLRAPNLGGRASSCRSKGEQGGRPVMARMKCWWITSSKGHRRSSMGMALHIYIYPFACHAIIKSDRRSMWLVLSNLG